MTQTYLGKVYLVGAGPGDPELMTRKAYRLLQQADVILFDRLVNATILEDAKEGCHLIYVGKKEGLHVLPQDEINRLLRDYAQRYPVVVRLKGGDPFLFGRGGEEALFLRKHGVSFEIVPGVTSALGAPAYAGIPVTQRGMAATCTMITGHLARGGVDVLPWDGLASMHTLIFLMAVSARQYIAQKLLEHGRPPEEPVAFIERGTSPEQRVTPDDIGRAICLAPIVKSPAIMLIGEVASLHEQLDWFEGTGLAPLPPSLGVTEIHASASSDASVSEYPIVSESEALP